ncbi:MAG: DASH family cryptochrome [Bacteroidia bacterium]|nr:DASH family cryptochrome [Bacteroidia bacterium]
MKRKVALVWFRNDLRLHDHEPLFRALERARVVPVYCLDPRQWHKGMYGFPKTGAHRTRFLLESLHALRARLRAAGSDLLIRIGLPEEILPELVQTYQASWIFAHKEVTAEETAVERAIEDRLFKASTTLELYWGATLYHLEDLPMPVRELPEIFTNFRKQVEKLADVRDEFPEPVTLDSPELDHPGEIPTLASLGLEAPEPDVRAVHPFPGGELAGLARLQTYFWEKDLLHTYKETRNGLLGADYSSKFSPWLALGCLSPRRIYTEIKRYERTRHKNDSTYWLIFELIWRDYFRFIARKHGNTLFLAGGVRRLPDEGNRDRVRLAAWIEGRTGFPFVDANMRELAATGFMSNRGRQNVASFLVHDLGVHWRMGAAYFESVLLDYDVCSNWGNWNYVSGTGNDPREDRYFNTVAQARRYDPKGAYIRHWLPELAELPTHLIFEPYLGTPGELKSCGVVLGTQYPRPVLALARSPRHF